ncbi:MAG: mechanosensitive ion channel family protein [Mycobacteriaceae bacterium]|uniref:mechanosensitive ion channel family protein n=1 Tax=Corynebacterium sp. TaxID=1720 RepID=UPI003F9A82FB
MDVGYFLFSLWDWVIEHGLPLATLLLIAILIPRIGRQVVRVLTDRFEHGEEETKSKLALVGALVYILEIVAYFVIVLFALTNLGVPALGAAVPATVVSAAVGFGAQNIIGDFLTGFFIISERHYGVGDVVAFDDTSDGVSGTVVKLTLRSTQIRTGNGELVTIPNSKATVTINYSKKWSKAVVDLDLPLTDNESMADLVDKVTAASHQAVESAGVSDQIRGEISVLPALSITPPTAAGLPWSVGMEVNVETRPAAQWGVERAIRANLVNSFWDRYQAPGELPAGPAGAATPQLPSAGTDTSGSAPSPEETDRVVAAATSGSDLDTTTDSGTADAPDTGDDGTATDAETTVIPTYGASQQDSDTEDGEGKHEKDADGNAVPGPYDSQAKNALSIGGRFRPSTTGLFIGLVVVGLLALFSTSPEDANPGFLSPDRWRNSGAAVETTETPAPQTPTEQDEPPVTDDTGSTDDGTGDTGDTGQQDTQDDSNQQNNQNQDNTDTTGTDDGSGNSNSGDSGSSGNTGGSGAGGTQGDQNIGPQGDQQENQSQSAGDGETVEEPTAG